MNTFSAVIDKLGGPIEVARVLGQTPDGVRKMRRRNRIEPMYWPVLVEMARERRVAGVSIMRLASIAVNSPRKRKAA